MRHQLPGWIHFRVDGGACTGPAGEEVIGPLLALPGLAAEAPLRRLIGEMGAAIPDAVAPAAPVRIVNQPHRWPGAARGR